MAFGFTANEWETMRDALLDHAAQYNVFEIASMTEGTHYIIEGALQCPDGRTPHVRVVWRIDKGMIVPRLISAYPGDAL